MKTDQLFSLAGKNAFITGACSGIGLAVAKRFKAAGARISVADIQLSAELEQFGVPYYRCDVSMESQVADALQRAVSDLGALDIVVNNAGIALEEGQIVDADSKVFEKTLAVNLNGVLYGLKYAPKYMNDGGSIINTASLASQTAVPEYTGYAASKSGVVSLTRQAAVELGARNIRVNAVCPGTTITPMEPAGSAESELCRYFTALGRPGLPEEQAAVFHFLAADDSAYVNAQAICVDGGWVHGMTVAAQQKLLS